ncbi:cytomatrix protein-like protein [Parasponia andersonii]|uniref:Cytomatrix protein-like protein n=1 Tax=Parasponia andersonii TaxID=3476 RepID=A0A2P5DBR0_PARAD|nr:cytomatrix protein-like protein [Parasponia andersonii]
MGTNRRSKAPLDRQNWQKIFNALVEMLQTQQSQLETLAKERKLLEDRIRMQHHRWVSDVRLLEDQISQMKGDFVVQDMGSALEAAKAELVLGLKQREAHINKLRLDYAETELDDFKVLFDLLSNKCSEPNDIGKDSNKKSSKSEEHRSEKLESEVTRLKQEYEKLSMEKNSEVSALLAEKKFIWNQYKILENNYTSKLKNKSSEAELADEKVRTLIASMEQLQSSNSEKDECIARLTSQLTTMKEESNQLKEETGRLSQELELLRKSRSASSITPVLTRCTTRTKTYRLLGRNSDRSSNMVSRKESSVVQYSDSTDDVGKGGRRSKRKGDDVASMSETPKLFSANFKVPKLKYSYPL